MNIADILKTQAERFDDLTLFFEGNSRILRETDHPVFLLSKLKPTIFSIKANGPIPLPGIDVIRTKLNAVFCDVLHRAGIRTSTIATEGDFILMSNEKVAPIEVVVKGALVGSPKHLYKGIGDVPTRSGPSLGIGVQHPPYVRFDWRNPLPEQDACMPPALAEYFIDTSQAEITALKSFEALKAFLKPLSLDLLDICFFMNESGDCICAEVSTDNSQIIYTGNDEALAALFSTKDKETMLIKAKKILNIIT
jgi:phosphoribosylaminoimidazole-succinocarboxamide synthase